MLSITITASEINNDKHYYKKVLIRLYQSRIGDYGPSNMSFNKSDEKDEIVLSLLSIDSSNLGQILHLVSQIGRAHV